MKNTKEKFKSSSGQTVLAAVIFFTILSLIIVSGSSSSVLRETKIARNFVISQKDYFLAESGAEDLAYRIMTAKQYDANETLTLDGNSTVTNVYDSGGEKQIISISNISNLIRKAEIDLVSGSSASFHYGVQAGEGGFFLKNSSFINGNVYSNGQIQGENSNLITGDVVSAGANGLVNGVHVNGSVYAHTISNSTVGGDAHYINISGSTVSGVPYPNSPDLPMADMPISDEQISEWETGASVSVITSPCPYEISSSRTLGPVKINCNVKITNGTITLAGPIWIKGNLEMTNDPVMKIDSSLGGSSVPIVVDNPDNRLTSSKVDLANTTQFLGTGTGNSYILIVSQNNSAENGGSEKAITVQNSVNGKLLLYAGHGEINIKNSVSLKEVTGYKIRLENSAQVIYETGLASLIFNTGPSGGYSIGNWEEVQ